MKELLNEIKTKCKSNKAKIKKFSIEEIEGIDLAVNEENISKAKLMNFFHCSYSKICKVIDLLEKKIDYETICKQINN
jgi:demethoxyubiquinone hydroxylase (CLK1/Coq7/Cat5 family)